jgi:hypothetical protein
MGDYRSGLAQVVDDDVDEPGAERAFLVLLLDVLHRVLLSVRVMVALT